MYLFGGVYVDLDVFCVRPMSELLAELRASNASVGLGRMEYSAHDHPDAIPNAVLLSVVPFHPFWLAAMDQCLTNAASATVLSIEQLCGPRALRQALESRYSCDVKTSQRCGDLVLFAPRVLYPVSWAGYRVVSKSCQSEQTIDACVQEQETKPHTITFWRKSWRDVKQGIEEAKS